MGAPNDQRDAGSRLAALLIGALLAASPAGGQEVTTFEFSFSNPGARSLGFGGAFFALADDATGAFANPAGLVQLTRPEVSIEGRAWSYSTPYADRGRFDGQPTGLGIDVEPGLRVARSRADLEGLSFLSYVHPPPASAPSSSASRSISEPTFRTPVTRFLCQRSIVSEDLDWPSSISSIDFASRIWSRI